MTRFTRGPATLVGVAAAGGLIWVATQIDAGTTGGYFLTVGLVAAAGFVLALAYVLGGWTRQSGPLPSVGMLLFAFLPALVAAGWIIAAGQPHSNTVRSHVLEWSGDIGIRGFVTDLREYVAVLAFGLGLLFGLGFEKRAARVAHPLAEARRPEVAPTNGDGRRARERERSAVTR